MTRLSPHAVGGYDHTSTRRRAVYGDAMAAGVDPRLDHHLGRGARRPPAGAVRQALRWLALRPRPPHRHQLAPRLRRRAGLQTLLLPPRQRRTQDHGDRRRIAPDPSEPAPRPVRRRASGLRPRRLPHQAVRAAHRGGGQAPQSDSRASRVAVPLRPRLGLPRPSGAAPELGDDRAADPLSSVHPCQGHRLDGVVLRLGVPHQVGTGRRTGPVADRATGLARYGAADRARTRLHRSGS